MGFLRVVCAMCAPHTRCAVDPRRRALTSSRSNIWRTTLSRKWVRESSGNRGLICSNSVVKRIALLLFCSSTRRTATVTVVLVLAAAMLGYLSGAGRPQRGACFARDGPMPARKLTHEID